MCAAVAAGQGTLALSARMCRNMCRGLKCSSAEGCIFGKGLVVTLFVVAEWGRALWACGG